VKLLTVQRLSRIGSWSLVLVGAGHLVTDLAAPATAQREEVVRLLSGVLVSMPGSHRSLWAYHHGFSLMMGLLLVGFGAVTLAVARLEADRLAPVLAISALVCLTSLALAATHFFAVPVLFTAVAFASFGLAWLRSRSGAKP
jgi:hypothetical protein